MPIRYELQASDMYFITAFERHWKQRRVDKYMTAIFRVAAVVFLLCALATVIQEEWGSAILAVCFSALILSRRYLNRLVIVRNIRKSPYYNGIMRASLTDDGLLTKGAISTEDVSWDAFTYAVRFSDGILLYRGPGLFNWLADSALAEGFTPEQAESVIQKHVSDYRQFV